MRYHATAATNDGLSKSRRLWKLPIDEIHYSDGPKSQNTDVVICRRSKYEYNSVYAI